MTQDGTQGQVSARVAKLDWDGIGTSLWSSGFAMSERLLSEKECSALAAMFQEEPLFRSVTDMGRKRFGSGVYKYFKYPLPEIVADLRTSIYQYLAPIANEFNAALKVQETYPPTHADLLKLCNDVGQSRPTPLLLHYEAGDFNCLHQDIYGSLAFPLQVTLFLSELETDYIGGEFLIQEQLPRAQSRVHALKPRRGQMIVFATRHRPEKSVRGFRKVNVKHGVATVESGKRDTLGIIFHDAK